MSNYTNKITEEGTLTSIGANDVVILDASRIVDDINAPDKLNSIASFDLVRSISATVSNDFFNKHAENVVSGDTTFIGNVYAMSSLTANSLSTNFMYSANLCASSISVNIENLKYNDGLCSMHNLCNEIYDEIGNLSNEMESRTSSHMQYYGDFDDGYSSIEFSDQDTHARILSNFLNENFNHGNSFKIQKGTACRIISAITLYNENSLESENEKLFENDYIIFNKDVIVKNAQISDFNVIRDAQSEGEQLQNDLYTISSILSSNFENYAQLSDISKVFIKDPCVENYEDGKQSDLSVVKLTNEEYAWLLSNDLAQPNTLYVISSEYEDAYGQQLKNLAPGIDLSDAVIVEQLSNLSKVFIKDPGVSAYENGEYSDISVVKLTNEEYAQLLSNDLAQPNTLYVISSKNLDAYGQKIINVAAGIESSDVVNVEQLYSQKQEFLYEISNKADISSLNNYALSSDLSLKQDKLSDAQISAINSVVDERTTIVTFNDGTTQSFNIVGEINNSSIDNIGNAVEVKIGTTVTSIGYGAFVGDYELTSVTIPNSVQRIGSGAFEGCIGLTSITIPNSVMSIGDTAFWGCSKLTNIMIPDNVTRIGYLTFENCEDLMSVMIGNGVTSIGPHAFSSCSSLTSVTIPDSVASIGDFALSGCDGLTSVTFLGKTLAEVQAMLRYPWGIEDESIITTWNDASQEWVNEQLSDYAQLSDISKVFIKDPSEVGYEDGKQSDLSVVKLTNEEYAQLLSDDDAQPNTLYVISSENLDAYGQQIKNISPGTDLSDAVIVEQLSNLSKVFIKDPGVSAYENGEYSDISVVKLTNEEYAQLLSNDLAQPNTLYVISSKNLDAYGQKIINVAAGIESSDAATFGQLTSAISDLSESTTALKTAISLKIDQLSSISELTYDSDINNVISAIITIRNVLSSLKDL